MKAYTQSQSHVELFYERDHDVVGEALWKTLALNMFGEANPERHRLLLDLITMHRCGVGLDEILDRLAASEAHQTVQDAPGAALS